MPVSRTVNCSRQGFSADIVRGSQSHSLANAEDDLALLGELHGVAEQVDQDLPQARHVADDRFGRIRIDDVGQVQALLGSARGQQIERALDALAQVEGLILQFEPVRLDLREVEDVVDDREQRIAAVADRFDKLLLLLVQLRVRAAGWSCR